jgi:putative oxidoreductase
VPRRFARYIREGLNEKRESHVAQSEHYGTQSYSGAIEGSGIGRYTPYVLSIVRIVVALLILQHGLSRLFGFPSPLPSPAMFSLYWFAGAIELVGGILLLGGLFTRSAAFILSGEMAFAYFLSHAPNSFFPILNRGDGAILYCFIFLYIVFAGSGPWSLDAMLRRTHG